MGEIFSYTFGETIQTDRQRIATGRKAHFMWDGVS
jgi:hypothetical protein